MSDLSLFFAGNATVPEAEEFVVSDRFVERDEKGKPKLDGKGNQIPVPWKIKSITEEENEALRNSATRRVKVKNGVTIPETNQAEYLSKLAVACVVYPNLNDAELQKSYGIRGADALIRKMLLSGEYAQLIQKLNEINGFTKDLNELADEVKN